MTTLNKTRLPGQEQVWLYFICGTTRPGYMGTTMNLQIILNTQKNPYLNQATQKNTCQIFIPKKIPESKISNPKKSFDHPRHLKSGVPPLGTLLRENKTHRYPSKLRKAGYRRKSGNIIFMTKAKTNFSLFEITGNWK